jgi:hypothetical protein
MKSGASADLPHTPAYGRLSAAGGVRGLLDYYRLSDRGWRGLVSAPIVKAERVRGRLFGAPQAAGRRAVAGYSCGSLTLEHRVQFAAILTESNILEAYRVASSLYLQSPSTLYLLALSFQSFSTTFTSLLGPF